MRTIRRSRSVAVCGATLALLLLCKVTAYAQGRASFAGPGGELQKGTVEVAGIFGRTLPVSWLRAHADRSITMGSVDVGRVMTNQLGRGPLGGQFEFLLEMTPLFVVRQPSAAFGLTASPLHMRWNFNPLPGHGLRPFAEASGGIVLTSQPVPVRTTTRFNFIDQAGFGLRFASGAKRTWLAGYRFQHISNAGRVEPNPGANFNFVYVGVSFLR